MSTLIVVHQKIAPVVKATLTLAKEEAQVFQGFFGNKSLLDAITKNLQDTSIQRLILDASLFPPKGCLHELRSLRLIFPQLNIILLTNSKTFIKEFHLSLSVLGIYDSLYYRANKDGLNQLHDELLYVLTHPTSATDFLRNNPLSEMDNTTLFHAQKLFLAVAGLTACSGTTKTALLLAQFFTVPVLFVELNPHHLVLKEYFLCEDDFDSRTNLYHLPALPHTAFCLCDHQADWATATKDYAVIILDLGVLPSHLQDARYLEFLRSDISIISSLSSPWDIQRLMDFHTPKSDLHLWLQCCPVSSRKILERHLKKKFSSISCLPCQPEWLNISSEQQKICKEFFHHARRPKHILGSK